MRLTFRTLLVSLMHTNNEQASCSPLRVAGVAAEIGRNMDNAIQYYVKMISVVDFEAGKGWPTTLGNMLLSSKRGSIAIGEAP